MSTALHLRPPSLPATDEPARITPRTGRFSRAVLDVVCHPVLTVAAATIGLAVAVEGSHADVWLDEAFTSGVVNAPWDVFSDGIIHRDLHIALYYGLLRVWSAAVGTSLPALRSLSILAMAATLLVAWLLVRRLLGVRAACLSVTLLALNPFLIRQAVTARPYALLLLCATAALYALVRAMGSARPGWWWVAFGALVVVGSYLHLMGILAGAALLGTAALVTAPGRRAPLRWVAAVVAVFWLPAAWFFLVGNVEVGNGVSSLSVSSGLSVGRQLSGSPAAGVLLLVAFALALQPWMRAQSQRLGTEVLLPVVALTPLGAALLLLPFQQLAEPRYFSIALVAGMAVACAQALTWRAGRAALWTSALVLLSLSTTLTAVRARPSTEAEDWTPAARAVVADAQPGDRLVFAQPYARIPFAIAAQDAGIMRAMPATAVPSTPLAATDPFAFSNASLDVNRLAARAELTGVQRVWYVTRTNDVLLPTVLPAVLLEQGFVPRSYTQVYGVRVDLLERAPTGVALP